jgi:hypothetical protein
MYWVFRGQYTTRVTAEYKHYAENVIITINKPFSVRSVFSVICYTTH